MSFSSEVKREIINLELDEYSGYYVLLGLMLNSSTVNVSSINGQIQFRLVLRSQIPGVIKLASAYFKKKYHYGDLLKTNVLPGIKQPRYYYLEINDCLEAINDFHLLDYAYTPLNDTFLGLNTIDDKRFFVRGLFLAHGSISNPSVSNYHFEITAASFDIASYTIKLFKEAGINAFLHERVHQKVESTYVVYIKKSEDISQALTYIGAIEGMFNFEDQRIRRDFLNNANRVTNCDIANERKCSETCQKQLEAIKYIKSRKKFNDMSVRLQTISIMRERYPDSSMEELAEYSENLFGHELSKSGIKHCFRDLMEYYEYLKENDRVK